MSAFKHSGLLREWISTILKYPLSSLCVSLKISFLSPYQTLLDMTKKKPSAIYLDLGCCCESPLGEYI